MDFNPRRFLPWIVYLIFFAVVNETVLNVATPAIARQFGLSASGVSWMMTIFMVCFGIGSVVFGRLSDLLSARSLLVSGIAIYCAGSVAGFALQFSYPLILAARAIQGIGGSAIPSVLFVVVVRRFAEAERGAAFGLVTSAASLGIGLGPVIGGLIASSLGWPVLFLVPLFMLSAVPVLLKSLPSEPRREGGVDLVGAALTAAVVGFLVVLLSAGGWYPALGMAVSAVALGVRIRTARSPFIKPSLLGNAKFRGLILSGMCLFAVVIGTFFLVPLMLSSLYDLSSSQIGLILFPGAMSSVVVGRFVGKLVDRRGTPFVALAGVALIAGGVVLMAICAGVSFVLVAAAVVSLYVGFSFVQTAMVSGIPQSLPGEDVGIGMGLFNLVGVVSGAIGAALVGRLIGASWIRVVFAPSISRVAQAGAETGLLLLFALIAAAGSVAYVRSLRAAAG